jgi:hypothetical protein
MRERRQVVDDVGPRGRDGRPRRAGLEQVDRDAARPAAGAREGDDLVARRKAG